MKRTALGTASNFLMLTLWRALNYLLLSLSRRRPRDLGRSGGCRRPTAAWQWRRRVRAASGLGRRWTRMCLPKFKGRTLNRQQHAMVVRRNRGGPRWQRQSSKCRLSRNHCGAAAVPCRRRHRRRAREPAASRQRWSTTRPTTARRCTSTAVPLVDHGAAEEHEEVPAAEDQVRRFAVGQANSRRRDKSTETQVTF